jgi:hypothetical protein
MRNSVKASDYQKSRFITDFKTSNDRLDRFFKQTLREVIKSQNENLNTF